MFLRMTELNTWCANRKGANNNFSDGRFRSHATYYFIAAGETHNWYLVSRPASLYYRMLHPLGKSQEGSRTFGGLPCPDGKEEAGSGQLFANGGFHLEEV